MEVEMAKQLRISGNVHDRSGNPIGDAKVKILEESRPKKSARYGKAGTFAEISGDAAWTNVTDQHGSYEADVSVHDGCETVRIIVSAFQATADTYVDVPAPGPYLAGPLVVPVKFSITAFRMNETHEDTQFTEGEVVILRASVLKLKEESDKDSDKNTFVDQEEGVQATYSYTWHVDGGSLVEQRGYQNGREVRWDSNGLRGIRKPTVRISGGSDGTSSAEITFLPRPLQRVGTVPVTMRRTAVEPTEDLALWVVIRKSSEAISFQNYSKCMDMLLCRGAAELKQLQSQAGYLPYSDLYAYRLLKAATEAFLMVQCGVANLGQLCGLTGIGPLKDRTFTSSDMDAVLRRVGTGDINLDDLWTNYLKPLLNGGEDETIPYLALVREKLSDVRLATRLFGPSTGAELTEDDSCYGLLRYKLTNPCLFELIWSYWHEEGMLVQTLHAITTRFQNIRGPGERDPLRMVEIDPLRPLNNLLWGYLQDEQYRIGVLRRAYEYDHQYGITLYGKAVPNLRAADSRSKFLEAFHNLLYLCAIFFDRDDDTTVIADGFPVLNALKEVHFLLAEGAHNQFGDMPSTARQEMMLQQWILARPEFREFLPTRVMVAYPEPWMDRVDAMKTLQGWTDVSVLHFRNLAVFGEQILLSIRFGAWSTVNDPVQASNWARFWRAEIQGYIHAYRAATGVDLTAEVTDARQAALRVTPPGILLHQRFELQRGQPRAELGSAPRVTATLPPARVRGRDR
jgi:hypothetical protein